MKILVIGGGISAEREVSLRSAQAVLAAAKKHHQAEFYDWDGSEAWLLRHTVQFDAVLPILHGEGGEDGVIQTILEKRGGPYLGSTAAASKLCFDKKKTLELLSSHGIAIPQSQLVTLDEYANSPLYNQPHVLKPYNNGSSVDTFIYPDPTKKDLAAIKTAFGRHSQLLLEEYVAGIEVTVPVLEGKTLPIIEIIPPKNGVFNFENKYNGRTQELVPPEHISHSLQEKAQALGSQVHKLTGCRHLSRIDMIISKDTPYVLEVNTLPGMTAESLYPKAATAAGMDFLELVDYFINMVANDAR